MNSVLKQQFKITWLAECFPQNESISMRRGRRAQATLQQQCKKNIKLGISCFTIFGEVGLTTSSSKTILFE